MIERDTGSWRFSRCARGALVFASIVGSDVLGIAGAQACDNWAKPGTAVDVVLVATERGKANVMTLAQGMTVSGLADAAAATAERQIMKSDPKSGLVTVSVLMCGTERTAVTLKGGSSHIKRIVEGSARGRLALALNEGTAPERAAEIPFTSKEPQVKIDGKPFQLRADGKLIASRR